MQTKQYSRVEYLNLKLRQGVITKAEYQEFMRKEGHIDKEQKVLI